MAKKVSSKKKFVAYLERGIVKKSMSALLEVGIVKKVNFSMAVWKCIQ
jgi:hypothetical protein